MKDLGIREFINQIIKELRNTVEERKKKRIHPFFNINNVEIEIHARVKKLTDGALNISVVQVGGEFSKEDIHQVKISLTPVKDIRFKKINYLDGESGNENDEKHIEGEIDMLSLLEQSLNYGVTEDLDISKIEVLKLEEIGIDKSNEMFKIQTSKGSETSSLSIPFKVGERGEFEYLIAKIPQKTRKMKRK